MMQMSQHHFSSNPDNFSEKILGFESHCGEIYKRLRNFVELANEASNEKSFVQGLRAGALIIPIQFYVRTTFTEILKTLLYRLLFLSTFSDLVGHGLLCNYFCLSLSSLCFFDRFPDREPRECGLYSHISQSLIDSEDTSRWILTDINLH